MKCARRWARPIRHPPASRCRLNSRGFGYLNASAEVKPEDADRVIAALKKIAAQMRAGEISDDEFSRAIKPSLEALPQNAIVERLLAEPDRAGAVPARAHRAQQAPRNRSEHPGGYEGGYRGGGAEIPHRGSASYEARDHARAQGPQRTDHFKRAACARTNVSNMHQRALASLGIVSEFRAGHLVFLVEGVRVGGRKPAIVMSPRPPRARFTSSMHSPSMCWFPRGRAATKSRGPLKSHLLAACRIEECRNRDNRAQPHPASAPSRGPSMRKPPTFFVSEPAERSSITVHPPWLQPARISPVKSTFQ